MTSESLPQAATVREIALPELNATHGVSCDEQGHVWCSCGNDELVRIDPLNGRIVARHHGLTKLAGTTFDGEYLWQISDNRILRLHPESFAVDRELPTPEGVHCSGMAWANGALWIGDFAGKRLVKIDARTGEVLKTLSSDRFVTGISWANDELWYGAWERNAEPVGASLRRVDPESGVVHQECALENDWSVSGMDTDAEGRIWCGGSWGGGLRAVRVS